MNEQIESQRMNEQMESQSLGLDATYFFKMTPFWLLIYSLYLFAVMRSQKEKA